MRASTLLARAGGWSRRNVLLGFTTVVMTALALMADASTGRSDNVVVLLLLALVGATLSVLWPSLDYRLVDRPMESLIAFVGCDGSGKSTLTTDLRDTLSFSLPVRLCYLGLGSGAMGERIRRLPLVGPAIERRLALKAAQSRTSGQRIPGLATAIVIYAFSIVRLHRFKRMLRLRRAGFVVLTDRFPQTEFPGCYDGPGLSAAHAGSWAVAQLVKRERRIYAWMTAFRPDVVVRLNVDAATALARKPDHRADLLVRKVAITPRLHFAGASIVDIDATLPYGTVKATAERIIADTLGRATERERFASLCAQGA